MALMACNDCGGDVSSTARTCPHCGYPFFGGFTTGHLLLDIWMILVGLASIAIILEFVFAIYSFIAMANALAK